MSKYLCPRQAGACLFLTLTLAERKSRLLVEHNCNLTMRRMADESGAALRNKRLGCLARPPPLRLDVAPLRRRLRHPRRIDKSTVFTGRAHGTTAGEPH